MDYLDFLRGKIQRAPVSGFDVDPGTLHPALKPHQRDAVAWALHGGRINRYTNPGELVGDPFGGLGTVPLRALKAGRRGWMSELNGDYWQDAVNYLKAEEAKVAVPTLFDMVM